MCKKFKSLLVVVIISLSSFVFSSAVFAVESVTKEPSQQEAFDQVDAIMGDFIYKMHSKPFKLTKPRGGSLYGYEFVYETTIEWPNDKYRLNYEGVIQEMLEYLYYTSPYDRELAFDIHVRCNRWFKEHINDPKYLRITYRMNEAEYKQLKTEENFIQKFLQDTAKINDRTIIIDTAYNSIVKSSFAKKYRNRIFMRCLARRGIKSELTFVPIKRKQNIYKSNIYAGIYVDNYVYDLYFDTKIPANNVKALKDHAVENRLDHENKPIRVKILKKIPFN